jgi:hypothetical protein
MSEAQHALIRTSPPWQYAAGDNLASEKSVLVQFLNKGCLYSKASEGTPPPPPRLLCVHQCHCRARSFVVGGALN